MVKNFQIKSVKAREILDSKGMPTIEVSLETNLGIFPASVPSGVSTGKYEALEMRDQDGRGVKKAIENIEKIITPVLEKESIDDQKKADDILINLDGTKDKSRLGANAVLPVSLAICRALSAAKNLPLYQYISQLADSQPKLPKPSFNMVEGGKHAENSLAFQEFMVIPQKETFAENFKIGKEIYNSLKKILEKKIGQNNINLSKEGAFGAPLEKITEAFDFILEAAENVGFKNDIKLAIDAAASSFFNEGSYEVNGEFLDKEKLTTFYQDLVNNYPIISIEDPFEEEDFLGFKEILKKDNGQVIVFGDDLLTSNVKRIKLAKEKGTYNGLLLKPNQIGTVSETIEAAKLAKSYNWQIMVANRAGETEDSFIADLAVGISAELIKSGAPYPKERMAKYERLVKIEEELKLN
jgi:enolase